VVVVPHAVVKVLEKGLAFEGAVGLEHEAWRPEWARSREKPFLLALAAFIWEW
jgi:hypothetical protein